jgi:4-hydroxybenzoate polyprenyltransferase
VAVTAIATLLAVAVDAGATTVLVLVAFLAGQLSIGWSNDWIDAERDIVVGRRDKPVAVGAVSAATVRRAALMAAAVTVATSFMLGLRAGVTHLIGVSAGWAYNAGLKSTVLSWAPYAVFFGLLPAVVTQALPGHPWPPSWMIAAGALLGIGAHFINVLPDLEYDRSTGVRGLPHRLGGRGAGVLAPLILVIASCLVLTGRPGPVGTRDWLILGVIVVMAGVSAVAAATGRRRLPLAATAFIAVIDVGLLIASGVALTA